MRWNPAQPELVEREHDLPPRWDGEPIEWGAWIACAGPMFVCPPPKDPGCSRCGSILRPEGNAGHTTDGLIRLYVTRCGECSLDVAVDIATGEVWDLDASDYGDAGSAA